MSGIYIPGMEMPKNCGDCKLVQAIVLDKELILYCPINGEAYCKIRKGCPLVPVPEHGRLIDADALFRKVKTECNPYGKPTIEFESGKKVLEMIENAPTIIEAEEGDG